MCAWYAKLSMLEDLQETRTVSSEAKLSGSSRQRIYDGGADVWLSFRYLVGYGLEVDGNDE